MDVISFLVALAGVLPGIAAWWTGRGLLIHLEDPALPELLLARRQRLTAITAVVLAAMIVLGGRSAYWGIPLLLVSLPVGGYALRRALGIETAGIAIHVGRHVKGIVGSLGFWILLAWTPQIVLALPARYRLASLIIVPILVAWDAWYHRVWLWLHDAEPLESAILEPHIAAIVGRAGIAAPRLYRIGLAGTRYVNALALPSLRQPSIVLGNALVELLEPDEAAAIYAHELSHIEQHSPRRLRRTQAMNRLLIVLAVALPFAAARFAPETGWWLAILWPVAVLVALSRRGRESKKRETESDLRAAALCGDADLVARALIKVHTHALIPRRWPVDFERAASHPSLARRIQTLRGEDPRAVPALDAPTILATAREGTVVAFDGSRAYWFDGVPAATTSDLDSLRAHASSARSVAWPELVELRVATIGADRALQAAHRNGDKWSVPLDAAQVGDVQRALDRVDVRLHRELGKRPFPDARVLATLSLLAMLMSGGINLLVVPVALAAFRPSAAALAALGAMSVGSALFDLLRDWPLDTMNLLAIALLLALGTASLWRAWKRSRSPGSQTARRENPRQTLFVLAGVAALIGILAALTTRQMSLAQLGATPLLPALSMALAGIAGALLVSRSRSANIGAGANALAAIILALPTLQASGLLTRRAHLIRTHATAVEIGRISLPLNTMSVALSPDGRRMLTRRYENDRAGGFFHYTARSLDGAPRELDALQAEFTDSDHLLSLRRTGDTLSLQLERADSSSVLWTSKLSAAFAARLSVSPSDRTWSVIVEKTVIAETEGDDSVVVFSGVVDSPSVSTRHLASTRSVVLNGEGLVAIGSRLIMPAYDLGNWRPGSLALAALMMPKTNVWEITPTGRRQIGDFDGFPQCGAADRGVAACVVRQRSRSELWTLADTGKPVFVGTLPLAEVILVSIGPGARVTAASRNNTVFVVDAAAGRLTEVSVPADSAGAVVVAQSAPGIVATLRRGIATTTLVLYRVP